MREASHEMTDFVPSPASISPSRRAWLRFKQHRLGFWSLILFSALVLISLGAELVSNDKPLLARYERKWYVPIVQDAAETGLVADDRGRDVLARLIYGFRVSVLFGLALTLIGVVVGVLTGAIQGFYGGRTGLLFQRFIEIWGSMPELYLLIIFSAVLSPSIGLLILL